MSHSEEMEGAGQQGSFKWKERTSRYRYYPSSGGMVWQGRYDVMVEDV